MVQHPGMARWLSLRLADLAVLALADESGPTLLERFWSQRGLGLRLVEPACILDVRQEGIGGGEDLV